MNLYRWRTSVPGCEHRCGYQLQILAMWEKESVSDEFSTSTVGFMSTSRTLVKNMYFCNVEAWSYIMFLLHSLRTLDQTTLFMCEITIAPLSVFIIFWYPAISFSLFLSFTHTHTHTHTYTRTHSNNFIGPQTMDSLSFGKSKLLRCMSRMETEGIWIKKLSWAADQRVCRWWNSLNCIGGSTEGHPTQPTARERSHRLHSQGRHSSSDQKWCVLNISVYNLKQ